MNNKRKSDVAASQSPIPDDRYLSVRSVSELFDIKEDTVRKWIQKRLIPSYNIRGLVRVKLTDLELMMVRRPSQKEVAKKLLKIV